MKRNSSPETESNIARCRLGLSLIALLAVYVDPTRPMLSRWIPLTSGRFTIDPYVLILLIAHLGYSLAAYWGISRGRVSPVRAAVWTLWTDVAFAGTIAFVTEGVTSPFYPFFAFAVLSAGFRSGLREALLVTAVTVVLYLCLIGVSAPGHINIYIMRPAYLAMTGYLVGYLGQERLELQDELRRVEATRQRQLIARDLHDGFVQALAGINLQIEGCRRCLSGGDPGEALAELTRLQSSVNREYDELRSYMRALAEVPQRPGTTGELTPTHLSLRAEFSGSIDLLDQVLQISREGLSNIKRHAKAGSAQISIRSEAALLHMRIEDDGVGFAGDAVPWSIVSRVKDLGGRIQLSGEGGDGAQLSILLPQA